MLPFGDNVEERIGMEQLAVLLVHSALLRASSIRNVFLPDPLLSLRLLRSPPRRLLHQLLHPLLLQLITAALLIGDNVEE